MNNSAYGGRFKSFNAENVSFMLSSFSKPGQLCCLSTQLIPWDAVRWEIPAASSLLTGGKVAHFENVTASEK